MARTVLGKNNKAVTSGFLITMVVKTQCGTGIKIDTETHGAEWRVQK